MASVRAGVTDLALSTKEETDYDGNWGWMTRECFRSAKNWVSQMGFSVAVGHAEDTKRVKL